MKKMNLLAWIFIVTMLTACNLTTSLKESNPDDLALKFTKLFFVQLAKSRNDDFQKTFDPKDIPTKVILPFTSGGCCSKEAIGELADFYEASIPPALEHESNFYENEEYKITAKFNEGNTLEYKVAAINLSKNVVGNDKAFVGLTVVVDNAGKQPTIKHFKYGFVYIPNPGAGKR